MVSCMNTNRGRIAVVLLLSLVERSFQQGVQPRVVGGSDGRQGRFPYFTLFSGRPCSGSLIAPDIVLTAAHCENELTQAEVGRYDLSKMDEDFEVFEVLEQRPHPFWNGRLPNFDMMLVKLDGLSTKPVLNLNTNTTLPLATGDELLAIGFDFIQGANEVRDSAVLQEGSTSYYTNEDCEALEDPEQDISLNNAVTSQWLCTDGSQKGICYGDAGAPLIMQGASVEDDIQVGIASGNFGCNNKFLPDVYQRVAAQYEWILLTVCEMSASVPLTFDCPSEAPSLYPSDAPSLVPSDMPSLQPSIEPTSTPTTQKAKKY